MCGILGIKGSYNHAQAKRAFESLAHRGVDASDTFAKEGLFLGFHHLQIEGTQTKQPFIKEGVAVLFNGEIYNYKKLQQALDYKFKYFSEVETLYALYKAYGERFVEKIEGMFAIAIIEDEKVLLYRDRFGKKPLFWAQSGDSFVFASEIKAIKPLIASHPMNLDILSCYLSYGTTIAPHTFYKNIYKLEASSYLIFENAKIDTKHYYSPIKPICITSEEEALTQIEQTLKEALDKRAVPAALLSGGVDSSLICALYQQKFGNLNTFSIGYDEYQKYSELPFAKDVASHISSTHREIIMTQRDFLDSIEQTLYHLDEPLGDPSIVPLQFLMRHIREDGFKSVLTGDGSDELFLGYRQYREFFDIESAKALKYKNWLKNYFKANFSLNKEWEWYKRIFEQSPLFRTSGEVFTDLQKNQFLNTKIEDNDSLRYIQHHIDNFGSSEDLRWYSYIDLKVHLGEYFLTKLDRASMMHSVEARSPFLDSQLVELSFAISPHLKIREQMPKYLLKKLARNHLPAKIVYRKKRGFSYPFTEWLNNAKEFDIISLVNKEAGLFKNEEIGFLLNQIQKGKFKQHAWLIYIFARWFKNNT